MKKFVRKIRDYIKVTSLGRKLALGRRIYMMRRRSLAFKAINDFGRVNLSSNERKLLLSDMVECAKRYHFSYEEYFRFNLENKSNLERCAFVPNVDIAFYTDKLNKPKNQHIFEDKAETATIFGDFYRRDFCVCESADDCEHLIRFLVKHKKAIVKPIASSHGIGIKLIGIENGYSASNVAKRIIDEYCTSRYSGAIVEELIIQDERMAALHPESVNTVRITSIRLDDRTVIFHPNLRVGFGDSVVDNAGSGGILAPVDSETGRVIVAGDRKGRFYTSHPETGVQLEGFEIPCWQEAIETVCKLAQVIPSNRYTGWDLALSKSGWVLVEANARGQWGGQLILQRGFRDEIEGYLEELGIELPFSKR